MTWFDLSSGRVAMLWNIPFYRNISFLAPAPMKKISWIQEVDIQLLLGPSAKRQQFIKFTTHTYNYVYYYWVAQHWETTEWGPLALVCICNSHIDLGQPWHEGFFGWIGLSLCFYRVFPEPLLSSNPTRIPISLIKGFSHLVWYSYTKYMGITVSCEVRTHVWLAPACSFAKLLQGLNRKLSWEHDVGQSISTAHSQLLFQTCKSIPPPHSEFHHGVEKRLLDWTQKRQFQSESRAPKLLCLTSPLKRYEQQVTLLYLVLWVYVSQVMQLCSSRISPEID